MWVYHGTEQETGLPALLPESVDQPDVRETAPAEQGNAIPLKPAAMPISAAPAAGPEQPAETRRRPTLRLAEQGCVLLLAAYLFGTFLSGVLSAVCTAGEAETLGIYLTCWREAFSAARTEEIVRLFWTELLTASGALTVLLLLGLSALGKLPIFCFMILYGAGTGLLSFQLLANVKLRTLAVYCIASGIPAALAAGSLCLFGATALQVSGKIQRCSFGKIVYPTGAWSLVGQFARTLVLFLPICGTATGLLYLCGQWNLFE